jgi:O-antigen/teichoic acid export membrane protein
VERDGILGAEDKAVKCGPAQLEKGRSLFVSSASWTGARAIAGFTRLGILLAMARVYGPGSFGQVSLAISLVEILRAFSEFGVDTISIRRFAQTAPEQRGQLLGSIIGSKVLLAICFYCLGVGALFFVTSDRAEVLIAAIAGLSLFFVSVLGAISSYLQSFFSMSRVFRSTLLSSAVSVGFAFLLIRGKASLLLVIIALPLADGLNLLLLWRRSISSFRPKFGFQGTASLLRESLPVGVMAILIILYVRLDNLFVFKLAGASALGLYSVCYRIVEPALMVPHSFSMTTYTLLSGSEHQDDGAGTVTRILAKTMWPAYAFILAATGALFLAGNWMLARFFPSYVSAYPILLVLAFTLAVRTFNITLTTVLNSRAKYSMLAKIMGVNLLVNILFVFLFVPRWGALGAAWAAVATELFNALMQGRGLISVLLPSRSKLLVENVSVE